MDYYGLYPKFKMNRPLNEKEREGRLFQTQSVKNGNIEALISDVSVIKINSTYLEVVDKYYGQKSMLSLSAAIGGMMMLSMPTHILFLYLKRGG